LHSAITSGCKQGFLRNLLKLEGVTVLFLRRRERGPDEQMGCQADISGRLSGTALERGIHQSTEVTEKGRRRAAGLPALYHARLITHHLGSKVTADLDKELAVDLAYLDFHDAFLHWRRAEGLSTAVVRNWLKTLWARPRVQLPQLY